MRIRFLRDEIYESEGLRQGPKFHEGEMIDARQDFGDRWIRRGAAEPVAGGADPSPEPFKRLRGDARKAAEAEVAAPVEPAAAAPDAAAAAAEAAPAATPAAPQQPSTAAQPAASTKPAHQPRRG